MDWLAILKDVGLYGLAILYLLWTVDRKDKRIDELVDREREDSAKAIATIEKLSSAVQANSDLIKDRRGGGGDGP